MQKSSEINLGSKSKTNLMVGALVLALSHSSAVYAQDSGTTLNPNTDVLPCLSLLLQDLFAGTAEHRPSCGVGENYQDNAPKTYSGASIGAVPVIVAPKEAEVVEEEEEEVESAEDCDESEYWNGFTCVERGV